MAMQSLAIAISRKAAQAAAIADLLSACDGECLRNETLKYAGEAVVDLCLDIDRLVGKIGDAP